MKKVLLLSVSIIISSLSFASGDFHPFKEAYNSPSGNRVLTDSLSIVASQSTICASGSNPQITFTATFTGSETPTYKWKKNGSDIQGATNYVYFTTNYRNGDVFTCVTTTGSGFPLTTTTSNSITITVTNSFDTTVIACNSYTFRDTYGPYTSSGNYSIFKSNSSGCDSVFYLNLTINSSPSKPTIASTNTEICSLVGSTANFSLSNPDAGNYHKWVAPSGISGGTIYWNANIVSGQGTDNVGMTFTSNLANKLLYVQVYDSSTTTGCVSNRDSLLLTMTIPTLDTILPISGLSSLCLSQLNDLTYTAYPGINSSAITGYGWSVINGIITDASADSASITVSFNPTSTVYYVKASAKSACGTRVPRSLSISKQGATSTPTQILQSFSPNVPAQTSVCGSGSSEYRIRKLSGVTSYNWSMKNGTYATIEHLSSGDNDTAVTVTFSAGFTTDSLMVSASNSCGTSQLRKLYLRVNTLLPPSAASISGEASPCNNNTYNYTATANAPTSSQTTLGSFRWYLPANAIITSSNADSSSVDIYYNSSFAGGSITIRTQSSCGILNSTYKTQALRRGTPGIKAISGTLTPCNNNSYSYTDTAIAVSNTQSPIISYRWVRPAGTTVSSSNADSSTITISFGPTYAGGVIKSYGVNACGTAGSSKTIQLKYIPPTPTSITSRTGNFNACIGDTISYTVTVPAPSSSQLQAVYYKWAKPNNTVIESANSDSSQIKLKFNSGYIGGTLSVRGVNICGGLGSLKTQSLTHSSCPSGTKMSFATDKKGMNQDMDVVVYPNPTNAGFHLQVNTSDQSMVQVKVMDIQGKTIQKLTLTPNEVIQFGNSLAPGSYLIESSQGASRKITRVVRY